MESASSLLLKLHLTEPSITFKDKRTCTKCHEGVAVSASTDDGLSWHILVFLVERGDDCMLFDNFFLSASRSKVSSTYVNLYATFRR